MLPSAHGSPLSSGSDDGTRVVPRVDRAADRTRFVPSVGPVDDHTRIVATRDRLDDRTTIVPMVRRPSRLRTVLPWAGFGIVAAVVIAATTAWASTMRGSDDSLLANATPPQAVVSQLPVPSGPSVTAAPADETTVPAAATRRPPRPTLAPVLPPKPAPAVVATTTVKPTPAAATTKAVAATTTRSRPIVGVAPAEQCTPTATTTCPAANQAGSTASSPTP